MTPEAGCLAFGGGALVGVALCGWVAPRQGPEVSPRRHVHAGLRRAVALYHRSPAGRRLERRLRAAGIDLSPAVWRLRQAGCALALACIATAVGLAGPLVAVGLGASAARLAGWALLLARRHRGAAAVAAAAAVLARRLATELRAGMPVAASIPTVARLPAGLGPLAHPVAAAARLVTTGVPPAEALQRSLESAGAPVTGRETGLVAAMLAVQAQGGGDPACLEELADALERAARVRSGARAALAESRMVAVAVPVLAATLAVLLVSGDPAVAVSLASPGVLLLVGACLLVAAGGVASVLLLTRGPR